MEQLDSLFLDSLKQLEFFTVLEKIAKFTTTEYGKNQILNSLPKENLEELAKELDLVDETINLLNRYENIPFENFGEIRTRIYKSKVENAVLSTGEILDVLSFLQLSRTLRSFILSKSEDFPKLAELVSPLYENRIIEKHIREAIDETGNVRDTASKELLRIRNEIIEKSAKTATKAGQNLEEHFPRGTCPRRIRYNSRRQICTSNQNRIQKQNFGHNSRSFAKRSNLLHRASRSY